MKTTREIKVKHRILNWGFRRPKVAKIVLDTMGTLRITRIPFLGRLHPFAKPESTRITQLPINVEVQSESTPLPPAVMKEIAKRTPYIHRLEICPCRTGYNCQKHAHDIACLFFGETGFDASPLLSTRISTEEAIAHIDRAVENGLVPTIARARLDYYYFMLKDEHKMIACCFCCDCCCALGNYKVVPQATLDQIYPRLDGLEITVSDKCVGCGTCAKHCYMSAIRVDNGKARHSETCRGCGRCGRVCPQGAVEIKITNPAYFGDTVEKFLSLATINEKGIRSGLGC